ncbi:MAG TPA: TetR family transcriptional regulator [Acidimicrobiales bacterium]|nr:TetR family transcriptional regulator [Acidimicrobiales bacterium]
MRAADVAARAGVSRQAVYLHFSNRSTLLVEMARRFDRTSGFRSRLRAARLLSPLDAFRQVLTEWFAYLPSILPVGRALESAALVGGDGADAYRDRMSDWRAGIRLDVERLHGAGLLHDGWTIDEATDWIWTHTHPTTVHHLVDERGWTIDVASARLTRMLEDELVVAV